MRILVFYLFLVFEATVFPLGFFPTGGFGGGLEASIISISSSSASILRLAADLVVAEAGSASTSMGSLMLDCVERGSGGGWSGLDLADPEWPSDRTEFEVTEAEAGDVLRDLELEGTGRLWNVGKLPNSSRSSALFTPPPTQAPVVSSSTNSVLESLQSLWNKFSEDNPSSKDLMFACIRGSSESELTILSPVARVLNNSRAIEVAFFI